MFISYLHAFIYSGFRNTMLRTINAHTKYFLPQSAFIARTGEELYIHASNGSVILPGGYSANNTSHNNHHNNQHHTNNQNTNNNTSTANVPSSLSVQQLSTSQLSGGLLNNNGAIMGGGNSHSGSSSTATSGSAGGSVPHSQSAHEIGQVPLTPLAQHQQALHHQLQLRFAANNANSGGNNSSGECCLIYMLSTLILKLSLSLRTLLSSYIGKFTYLFEIGY